LSQRAAIVEVLAVASTGPIDQARAVANASALIFSATFPDVTDSL
jgi:hypothetical protein